MASNSLSSFTLLLFTNCTLVFLTMWPSHVTSRSPLHACDVASDSSLASLGFCNTSLELGDRVADLVERLTLEEKVKFLVSEAAALPRLGIPEYKWWSEALHGVSYGGKGARFSSIVPGATSFPQVITTAASFNSSLFLAIGQRPDRGGAVGKRLPERIPCSVASTGQPMSKTKGGDPNKLKVASCCKHYTAYDLDNWKGVDRFHFNAIVSQQDLDDTFQPPFKSCVVDGNVGSVMCSYNQVNGKPTCADPDLLTGIVRSKWNLNGYIVTDCDSIDVIFNSQHYTKTPEEAAADSILAGVDLDCGTFLAEHTEAAVKSGLLGESAVDKSISNNFATLMRLGFFDGSPKERLYDELGPNDVCSSAHQELALDAARQGLVLLKNDHHTLPFFTASIKSLALIGPNANVTKTMIGNYEGTPCKYTTPLQGLLSYTTTTYLPGCVDVACGTAQVRDAAKLASTSDATILVMGIDQSTEREMIDRTDVLLPGQQQLLINVVANASKGPVVLVIMSGGGFDITFAKNNNKINAILWAGYPGQAGGAAIADIVFGSYNPSGRLPMTWYPQAYVDEVPMTNMNMRPNPSTNYPGRTYRFYTGETVYSFGDGLSYSKFTHRLLEAPKNVSINLASDHLCRASRCESLGISEDGVCQDYTFNVHIKVRNEGAMRGGHTVFLYYKPPRVHNAPRKHLIGFEKVNLGVGEEGSVQFRVDGCRDLSLVDENGGKRIALGLHELHIEDLKHSFHVTVGI